jgi:hypothetical protein
MELKPGVKFGPHETVSLPGKGGIDQVWMDNLQWL